MRASIYRTSIKRFIIENEIKVVGFIASELYLLITK